MALDVYEKNSLSYHDAEKLRLFLSVLILRRNENEIID